MLAMYALHAAHVHTPESSLKLPDFGHIFQHKPSHTLCSSTFIYYCVSAEGLKDVLAGAGVECDVISTAYLIVRSSYVHAVAAAGGTQRVAGLGADVDAMFIRVGNSKVITGLLDLCLVPPHQREAFARLLTAVTAALLAFEAAGGKAQRESVLLWQDLRKYIMQEYSLPQAVVDTLQPLLVLPAPTFEAVIEALSVILGRHRSAVVRRVSSAMTAQLPASAGNKEAAAAREVQSAAIQQLRGLLLLQHGLAELQALFLYLKGGAEGYHGGVALSQLKSQMGVYQRQAADDGQSVFTSSTTPEPAARTPTRPSTVSSKTPTGGNVPTPQAPRTHAGTADQGAAPSAPVLPKDAVASEILRNYAIDLGMGLSPSDCSMYHGCLFQIVFQPKMKVSSLRLQPGKTPSRMNLLTKQVSFRGTGAATPAATPSSDELLPSTVETLLKIGHAYGMTCERDCVARGGRYEELLLRYRDKVEDRSPPPHAVHARFAVQKLADAFSAVAAKTASEMSALSHAMATATGGSRGSMRFDRSLAGTLGGPAAGRLLPSADVLVWTPAGRCTLFSGLERACVSRYLSLSCAGLAIAHEHPDLASYHDAVAFAARVGAQLMVTINLMTSAGGTGISGSPAASGLASVSLPASGTGLPPDITHTRLDIQNMSGRDAVTVSIDEAPAVLMKMYAVAVGTCILSGMTLDPQTTAALKAQVSLGSLTAAGIESVHIWAGLTGSSTSGGSAPGGVGVSKASRDLADSGAGSTPGGYTTQAAGHTTHVQGSGLVEGFPSNVQVRVVQAGEGAADGGSGGEWRKKRQPMQVRIANRLLATCGFVVQGLAATASAQGQAIIHVVVLDAPLKLLREVSTAYQQASLAVGDALSSSGSGASTSGMTAGVDGSEVVVEKAQTVLAAKLEALVAAGAGQVSGDAKETSKAVTQWKRVLKDAVLSVHRCAVAIAAKGGGGQARGATAQMHALMLYSTSDDKFDMLL